MYTFVPVAQLKGLYKFFSTPQAPSGYAYVTEPTSAYQSRH